METLALSTVDSEQITTPHFTTIIRWVCRIGYYLLNRPNKKVCSPKKPWICIADHTIQVGTNKAFAILGIPAKTMKLGRALTLKDVTVLSIQVKKSWTGDEVAKALRKVFKKNGVPVQIVIDGASNLRKGVNAIVTEMGGNCHVTYDITHLIANLLKKKYEGSMNFHTVMKELSVTSKRIAQTDIGYLLPPKLREKSRFLNLPSLAKWFDKVVNIFDRASLSSSEKKQIKKHFSWIWKPKWEQYIRKFSQDVLIIKDVQKILKNTGMNEFSYLKACSKLADVEDTNLVEPIINALTTELEFTKQAGFPMLLTSDIIESLFGKHKSIIKPHKLSEISRSILSIPVICEDVTPGLIEKAFNRVMGKDVDQWAKRNIPPTLLSRKKIVMANKKKNSTKVFNLSKNVEIDLVQLENGQYYGVI
jgi:hypothetical protein